MDAKDKRIIYELDKNSRSSYSQISKALRMPQETVRFRINRLIKDGVIQKFLAIINTTRIGNSYYQIMLKLQNVNEDKRKTIINYLKNNDKVAWIGNLEGIYDIAFIMYVKNQIQLQSVVEDIYARFSKFIMKKNISINLYAEFYPRDYLIGKQRPVSKVATYKTHEKTIELDMTDAKICAYLGKDARATSVEMENAVGVSSDSILQRIRKLKKEGIILGNNLVLNQEKMNQAHYKILLYLNNISKEKENKLLSFVRMNNQVIAIVKTLAEWDIEIDIEVTRVDLLKQFTMAITEEFSDIIRDYNILRIVSMPKYTFYP